MLSLDYPLLQILDHHSRLQRIFLGQLSELSELVRWNDQLGFLANFMSKLPEAVLERQISFHVLSRL